MKWFDNWFYKQAKKAWERDQRIEDDGWDEPKRGRLGRGNSTPVASSRRVEHNYDDRSVINFKVYGANGGLIVETSRYDDKTDNERIKRYVIEDGANMAESLSKIVTMEYMS
jgi:hypothetical protein